MRSDEQRSHTDVPPGPGSSGREGRYFVGRPNPGKRIGRLLLWFVLGLLGGAVVLMYVGVRPAAPVAAPEVIPKPAETKLPPVQRGPSPGIAMAGFTGKGATVAEFVALLKDASPLPLQCELGRTGAGLLALRLSGYDGESPLPLADALALLQFAGIAGSQDGAGVTLRPVHSAERLWRSLAADVDPNGPDWGALRPWRSIQVASERDVAALLAECRATPSPDALHALAWVLGGARRVVTAADEGRIVQQVTEPASEEEIRAAREFLATLTRGTAPGTTPELRAAAAAGLGEILSLEKQAQTPADAPVLTALGLLLKDSDSETAHAAVLALGNSASVPALSLLSGCLQDWRGRPENLAFVLAALRHAEALGRRLDQQALGAENWERRRELHATVRAWLISATGEVPAAGADGAFAAAWLRAAEVFRPDGMGQYAAALQERLLQARDARCELVAVGCDLTGKTAAAVTPASPLYLAVVAGPLWQCRDFPTQEALALLQAGDHRGKQAAAWRLARPQLRPGSAPQADEAALAGAVARELESAMQDASARRLRGLALDALYRERRRLDANGVIETWRFRWEADVALKAFLEDKDRGVQSSAAGIVAKLGNSADINALAQADLAARAPEALERLFTALAQRWSVLGGQGEYLTPGIVGICERVIGSGDDVAAGRAGWLRLHQPDLDSETKVRLAGAFKSAAARAGAVRALGAGDMKGVLQPKLVVHLLSDPVAKVRAAVFEARLPRAVSLASDRATLYLRGLADTEAVVRLAAVRSLELRAAEYSGPVGERVRELADKDADPEVRAAAAGLLRRWTESDAGGTPQRRAN